jgi:DGQHR domain-containing protein
MFLAQPMRLRNDHHISRGGKSVLATKKISNPISGKGKHSGTAASQLRLPAFEMCQGNTKLYVLKSDARALYKTLSINRRTENKDEGYQRTLSVSRVQAITRHLAMNRAIPGAIVVCFDKGKFDAAKNELVIPTGTDVGWVIDGQHRLAGAEMAARAGLKVDLAVVAFIGLDEEHQIEQFITINREAKNVPTSLYLDLIKKLPVKKAGDAARERAANIGTQLRSDEDSPFFEKIVVTIAPKEGQLSLTNFVRKIAPLVIPDKGLLHIYSEIEQRAVVANYYRALKQVFPKTFEPRSSIFFKTLGFGALWNAFPTVFSLSLKYHKGFTVKDAVSVLKKIESTDFSEWKQFGTGSQAEITAGEDLKTSLLLAFNSTGDSASGTLRV